MADESQQNSGADDATGTLYLVATPIGNLEDITLRALRILKEVDLVAAEDTRHSRKLFSHFGITTPLTSYHRHIEAGKGEKIIDALHQGKSVALISDAGTPAIADPGYRLVCRCVEEGIAVVSVPGPSAIVTALSASGLQTDRFAFEGFLPAKAHGRRELLESLKGDGRTLVFYEAPHRLLVSLEDMVAILGAKREVVVARELTKIHEEVFRGTLSAAIDHFSQGRVRGEIVLMLGPPLEEKPTETVREALARLHRETRLSRREIVKQVARDFGLPGSDVYRESLDLSDQEEP